MDPEAQAAVDAALSAHFDGAGTGGDSTPASAATEAPATQTTPEAPGATPAVEQAQDSPFTSTAMDALPPEMQSVYKSLQGDYTRKMQEIAQTKAQYQALQAQGVAPDQALQAVDFYNRLNSDPAFAAETIKAVIPQLEQMGYWAASQAVAAQQTAQPDEPDSGYEDPNYTAVSQEMARLRQELDGMRQQAEAQQYMAEMSRQQALLQQQHPEYTDNDFKGVFALSHSTAGDLVQANSLYQGIKAAAIAQYAANKMAIPQIAPTTDAVLAETAPQAKTIDEAHKWVMENVIPGLAANS